MTDIWGDPFAPDPAPVAGDFTVELTLPSGNGAAITITCPSTDLGNLPAFVAANRPALMAALEAAGDGPAPTSPGSYAVTTVTPTTGGDMVTIEGPRGPITFPSTAAFPSEELRPQAVAIASSKTGVPTSDLVCFDNRYGWEKGEPVKVSSLAVVKFTKDSAYYEQFVTESNGRTYPGTVAWVSWSTKRDVLTVSVTKEFEAFAATLSAQMDGAA